LLHKAFKLTFPCNFARVVHSKSLWEHLFI
jgi:hypothetical protein